jgi:hypothetical protein
VRLPGRQELKKIIGYKARWVKVAGVLFVLGSLALGLLVGVMVWPA